MGGAQAPPEAPVPGDLLQAGPAGLLQSEGGEAVVLQPALSFSSFQAAGTPAGLDTVNCTVSTHSLVSRVSKTFPPPGLGLLVSPQQGRIGVLLIHAQKVSGWLDEL